MKPPHLMTDEEFDAYAEAMSAAEYGYNDNDSDSYIAYLNRN